MAKDTKDKILAAATKLYVEKGFSGASISMIAREAGINQSLIYHHVGSKEDLWIAVKGELLAESDFSYADKDYNSLEEFIDDMIENRIRRFSADTRAVRFLMWQSLEDNTDLIGGHRASAKEWIDVIDNLKKKGKVNKNHDTKIIFTYLLISSTDFLLDQLHYFRDDPKLVDKYIDLFKKSVLEMFSA